MNARVRKVLSAVKLVSPVEAAAVVAVPTTEELILAELQNHTTGLRGIHRVLRSMADDVRTTARVQKRMLGNEFHPTTLPERDPDRD